MEKTTQKSGVEIAAEAVWPIIRDALQLGQEVPVRAVCEMIARTCVSKERYSELWIEANKWQLTIAALWLDGKLDHLRGKDAHDMGRACADEFLEISKEIDALRSTEKAQLEVIMELRKFNRALREDVERLQATVKAQTEELAARDSAATPTPEKKESCPTSPCAPA